MTHNLNKKPRNFFAEWNARELEKADNAPIVEKLVKSVTHRVFMKSEHVTDKNKPYY